MNIYVVVESGGRNIWRTRHRALLVLPGRKRSAEFGKEEHTLWISLITRPLGADQLLSIQLIVTMYHHSNRVRSGRSSRALKSSKLVNSSNKKVVWMSG